MIARHVVLKEIPKIAVLGSTPAACLLEVNPVKNVAKKHA